MGEYKGIKRIYHDHHNKLLFVPILLFLLAVVVIIMTVAQTGDFIYKGVSLRGGITLTASAEDVTVDSLKAKLQAAHPGVDATVRLISESGSSQGFIVEVADLTPEQVIAAYSDLPSIKNEEYSIESTGPSLGQSFFRQIFIALLLAFLFMAIVIFLYFRKFVPSISIVLAAFFDIVITIGVLDLFKVSMNMAGIAALLMLIGYSIDTNIVLSVRVLKRKMGSVFDRVISATTTGLTMTGTSLIGVLVAFIFSSSLVIKEIMLILVIGLVADLFVTWLFNAGVMRWYMAKHHKEKHTFMHRVKWTLKH